MQTLQCSKEHTAECMLVCSTVGWPSLHRVQPRRRAICDHRPATCTVLGGWVLVGDEHCWHATVTAALLAVASVRGVVLWLPGVTASWVL
jgi:hypothetical protein